MNVSVCLKIFCRKIMALIYELRRPWINAKIYRINGNGSLSLDLGSGGPGRPGTIGIDSDRRAPINWDLSFGIPCNSESVCAIYSDHFFEHLSLPIVVALLKDCHRVLLPGGRLRFTVPHIDPYLEALCQQDINFLTSRINDVPHDQKIYYATPFDRIIWLLLRNGEHRSIFSRDSILHKVKLAGFENAQSVEYDPSIDANYRFSSVYVEAFK